MKKITLVLFTLVSLFSVQLSAQEKEIYDQYHFNYYLINPAVAGADKCTHLMLTTRNNWVGLDGPSTQALSVRSRITDKNFGIGGYVYNDRQPDFSNMGAQLTFAYHIPMSQGRRYLKNVQLDRQLSFGVSFKVHQASYTSTGTQTLDPADVSESEFAPNANFGMYYVSYGFFSGISFTNLIPYEKTMTGLSEPIAPTTGFLFLGKSFDLANEMMIEPSVNFNFDVAGHKQIEGNLKFAQNNPVDNVAYWAQLSYRHNLDNGSGQALSLIPIVGARINKFQLAYAFNLNLSGLAPYNYGTHEVMLAYTFCVPKHFCR